MLLVVDQFEEVFTHRPAARERDPSWREETACFAAESGAVVDAQPAQAPRVHLREGACVEMILRDMRGHPAVPPLLEESLAALWEKRRGPWLTLDATAAPGEVGGALAAKADALYVPLSPDDQRLIRRIFLGLILWERVLRTRVVRVPAPALLGAADRREQVEALLRRFCSAGGSRLINPVLQRGGGLGRALPTKRSTSITGSSCGDGSTTAGVI